MSHIFISHVERDAAIMQQIADGLEAAGYSAWYFERDILPGKSYLVQITQAIEQCDALVLVISPNALGSDQVTKEVVGAFERGKPFFPVLISMTPPEFKERQPEWRHALGGTAMITIGPGGIPAVIDGIMDGLKAQGIQPGGTQPVVSPPGPSLSTPAGYTPKYLADKILAARSTIEGERKQVTVLFADVTGFTSMAENMDPEEVHGLISECLDFLTDEIHRYEGTIAQFLGDGVMALFGAPIAHEDAPQRALYAALGIQGHLRDYADQLRVKGIEFDMRIGLNTGLVVVGRIGDDLTMEYAAMGDTVNLASRMESTAEPGTIQVTENTHRLTEGYFGFDPLGEVQVKGKEEPVKTYRVLGLGQARTRLAAGMLRGLTPFVGREKELEHLKDCYHQAKEGKGQVVGMVGEPGVGKSRILLELTGTLPQEEYTYLDGQCLHYGETMAYLPILHILRSYFDVGEGERESVIKKRIEGKITQLDEKLSDILPPLQEILSLTVEDEEYGRLDPQQKREKTFEAIRNLLVRESQNRPLILAVEDLHWIDKTSEEFLTYLIEGLSSAHILLILLYRSEYAHLWASKTYYSQIRVDQLPTSTSAELVKLILKEGEVVPELNELVLNRAAGNPLFVEEFTHTLLENGYIQRKDHEYVLSTKASDIQVPDTIQGIIAARMDRLEDNLKRTMQMASVIGRDFAYRILQTITGMREELKSYLLNLQGLEFIYEKSLFPELEYVFKHALTQEVAYNSLLLKRRREIHEKIGKAIEELYAERLEEFYEILAHHYSRSENHEKAYQYLKLSAEKAIRNYSLWEAFRSGKEAIITLSKLPDTEGNKRKHIEVRLLIRDIMAVLGYPNDSLHILQEGERLSRELGDEKSLIYFLSVIGNFYAVKGDIPTRSKYHEQVFLGAERIQDIELMASTGLDIFMAYGATGEQYRIVKMAPRVIGLLEKTQRESESFGRGFNVYSILLAQYGQAMGQLGNFEDGEASCQKALRFALNINDLDSIALAEYMYGWLFTVKGDGRSALKHVQNAIKYAEEGQIAIISSILEHFLGTAYYLLGDLKTAREHSESALRKIRDIHFLGALSSPYYQLGVVDYNLGDLKNARSCVEKALKLAQKNLAKNTEALSWILMGRIFGKEDISESDRAEEHILNGIRILDELTDRPDCYKGYLYLGELYADTGQKEKALETLKKAQDAFQEMGMDYWLRRTQEVLDKIGN
jgi:class 3 adenylate cyclase/tetratricopeptide (TPR) repeat protein